MHFDSRRSTKARVDAVGREHRVGDALRRILIVVETGGAEGEIEIGDDRIEREIARDRPADVVRDGGGADAAFGADHGDDAADRLGVGLREQPADRAHDVDGADRRDQIVADAAPRQLAIERHVVDAADDDHARAGVADFGELVEPVQDFVGMVFRLEHDDVRRRRTAIGLDRGGDAAHLDFHMRLAEAAVFAGGLHGGGGFNRLAERLDRDARRGRDVFVGGVVGRLAGVGSLFGDCDLMMRVLSFAEIADFAVVVAGGKCRRGFRPCGICRSPPSGAAA